MSIDMDPNNVDGQQGAEDVMKDYISFPPGIRFKPSDKEMIHYLSQKVAGKPLPCQIVKEVNIWDYDPQQLTDMYTEFENQDAWYFFTPRMRKYPRGDRPSRTVHRGYWKSALSKTNVYDENRNLIGSKTLLNFLEGKQSSGIKTKWKMQEFKINQSHKHVNEGPNKMLLDDWVLCKIYFKERKNHEKALECKRNRASQPTSSPKPKRLNPPEQQQQQQQQPPSTIDHIANDQEFLPFQYKQPKLSAPSHPSYSFRPSHPPDQPSNTLREYSHGVNHQQPQHPFLMSHQPDSWNLPMTNESTMMNSFSTFASSSVFTVPMIANNELSFDDINPAT